MNINDNESFEVQLDERDGYLYAFISGEKDSLSAAMKYWKHIFDQCKRRGYKTLLVEEHFPNQATTMEMYTITNEIAKMTTPDMKIAFVDRNSEHNNINAFGETVALNRGVQGRVFMKFDDAKVWLKS